MFQMFRLESQFRFRAKHSTIDQVYIKKYLEEKKVFSAIFLDVTQAFNNKVYLDGLIGIILVLIT